jgi:DNA-binding LacI/PurR family transcriptional regulator
MGRVTLQTIADHVGVSRMTVSNAFSRPNQLSATLRDRILEDADELGYIGPDPTARALASWDRRHDWPVAVRHPDIRTHRPGCDGLYLRNCG